MLRGIIFLALISTLGTGSKNSCTCRPAAEGDWPHSANESVVVDAGAVKWLRGSVTLPNGEPIPEAVVEVYEYSARDKNLDASEVAKSRKRSTACLTNEKGEFCLARLPAGKYVLKVGTRTSAGINDAYVVVNLVPNLRSTRTLELTLQLGR